MLRIAVPNKGALSEPAAELLQEAGYRRRGMAKELVVVDHDNDVELFHLRPRDIAVYVGSGTVDVGITGQDMLLDSRTPAAEILPLGFARSTFRFAAPVGEHQDLSTLEQRHGSAYQPHGAPSTAPTSRAHVRAVGHRLWRSGGGPVRRRGRVRGGPRHDGRGREGMQRGSAP